MQAIARPALLLSLLAAAACWGQAPLPEGSGKAIVEAQCAKCHGLDTVARAGYSREEWRTRLAMMTNVGATLAPGDVDTVLGYLSQHFPERAAPAAAILPGPAHVSIHEWFVPTAGSRPHDPLATRDGSLWYSGQFANLLGRLDPATGKFREYRLPVENSGPHGLVADRDGNIWFTANFQGYIGKLDPASGKVTQYKLPDPKARDPHTPIFDRDGILWFTVQSGNFVGRLDPATEKITEWPSPSGGRSEPYGVLADGELLWYSVSGVKPNTLVRFDTRTQKFQTWAIPSGGGVVRNMMLAPDGNLALALSGVNGVALVEKK
jgi:virginiamycin B lyase